MALAHRELAQKVFIDFAERIAFDVHRHRHQCLHLFNDDRIVQQGVGLSALRFRARWPSSSR